MLIESALMTEISASNVLHPSFFFIVIPSHVLILIREIKLNKHK